MSRFALSETEEALLQRAEAIAAPFDLRQQPLEPHELRALYGRLAPLGYLGSVIPQEDGGAGLDPVAFGALCEGLAPALPLLGNHSVQRYIHAFGTPEQRARFLPPLLRGETIGAIAITEPAAGADLARIATTARRTGSGYVLDGVKTWVMHGRHAGLIVVLAKLADPPGGLTRFLVDGATAGLSIEELRTIGLPLYSFARLTLAECAVPVEQRLGGEGEGTAAAKSAFPIARALAALQALRVGSAAVDEALRFAAGRVLFRARLADHDLIRHFAAESQAQLAAGRLLAYQALDGLDSDTSLETAAAAKFLACSAALAACQRAAEILGSAGLLVDHPVNHRLADLRMMLVVDGTSDVNRIWLGSRIVRRPRAEQSRPLLPPRPY